MCGSRHTVITFCDELLTVRSWPLPRATQETRLRNESCGAAIPDAVSRRGRAIAERSRKRSCSLAQRGTA